VRAQIEKEVMGIVDMLVARGKFQKAANLLYACVLGDSNNESLRARWVDLIAKTNTQVWERVGACTDMQEVGGQSGWHTGD
jgi:hypothetical protein